MSLLASKSPAEVHLLAHRARETIKASLRETARIHSDRIRKIDGLMSQISATDFEDGETLAGIKALSLSPELEKLIVNPTAGL